MHALTDRASGQADATSQTRLLSAMGTLAAVLGSARDKVQQLHRRAVPPTPQDPKGGEGIRALPTDYVARVDIMIAEAEAIDRTLAAIVEHV